MGFKTGDFPPVDVETFLDEPFLERTRVLGRHWAEYGFGTPKQVHAVYIMKLAVLYIVGGVAVATWTSHLTPWHVAQWFTEPIVYQKVIFWTVLLEVLGIGGSWGPMAGHFKPMTGGFRYWAKLRTIRLPPWPGKVPGTAGDERTVVDVVLYVGIIVNLVLVLVRHGVADTALTNALPHARGGLVDPALIYSVMALIVLMGLRDKTVFLAARSEQYLPAMFFFSVLGFTDMMIALKLLIVVVWMGAGVSKFGKHFSHVVPPMVSNAPFIPSRRLKLSMYRSFPDDLRPSPYGGALAHGGGTLVELVTPLVLLFSTNRTLTLAAIALMISFHLFIDSTFPLAVPLEWNILFAYATGFLFWNFPAEHGYGLADMSHPWITALILAGLVFFPVLGNLRPDLVSFLPSMRQYAGNWATGMWGFAPGAEAKLDAGGIVKCATNQVDQLLSLYPAPVAEITMQQTVGWRSLHSQGRALVSLMLLHVDDIDRATVREGEFVCNTLIGWNFGEGHLHDEQLIAAVQKRCHFAPGELVVAWIESQPIHSDRQQYKVIDAALGVIERGSFLVSDAVEAQPWLPDGPIPFQVAWRAAPTPAGAAGRDIDLDAAATTTPKGTSAAGDRVSP
jgi:hypothetical protein